MENHHGKKVNVFVYNNCSRDARVLKEASSLARAGYDLTIIAVLDNNTVPDEERDGFRIHRVKRDSIHVKVIASVRNFFALIQRILLFPFRLLTTFFLGLRRLFMISIFSWASLFARILLELFHIDIPQRDSKSFEKNLSIGIVARIIRNPHRYPLRDYMRALFTATTFRGRVIGSALGLLGLPFYLIARVIFLSLNWLQSRVIDLLRRMLMPFHRSSVFQDYYKKAAIYCSEHPADFLHFHDLHTLPIIDFLENPEGVKFIYDSHELYTEIHTLKGKQKRKYKAIEAVKIREVDHVITVNPSIARELSERYGVPEPSVIMNCPPPMDEVPQSSDLLRKTAGLQNDDIVILYQGGYSSGRGLEELVKAVQWLERGKLVMMGWGLIENELRLLSQRLGLEDKIRFIPPAEQHEVLNYTCGADIGVIPYRAIGLNNYYTSPNKLFEYIQAHVVVAGSKFPELERVVNTYEIGQLFDPEDPKSIANCLNEMTSDLDRLREWKKNVIKAADRFHWGEEEKKLLGIYEKLGGLGA